MRHNQQILKFQSSPSKSHQNTTNLKMNKIIIFFAIIFGLSSCLPSNNRKAEQLAAKYIKEILYHPESYKPIETRVDSSFVSMEIINETKNLFELYQILGEYGSKFNSAERTMETNSFAGYYGGYGKVEYRQAKQDYERYKRLITEKLEELAAQLDRIKSLQSATGSHKFNGWKVYHKYSSSNGLGNVLAGEYIFLCDKKFNIIEAYSMDEYKIMTKVVEIIMQSKDLQDFADRLEEFSLTHNNYEYGYY